MLSFIDVLNHIFFYPANIFIISFQNSQVHDSFLFSLSFITIAHIKKLKRIIVRCASNLRWGFFFIA